MPYLGAAFTPHSYNHTITKFKIMLIIPADAMHDVPKESLPEGYG